MSSRTKKAGVAVELEKIRAIAWDQVAKGELAFDFTLPAQLKTAEPLAEKEKVGVKEAIVRWLEEQI